VTTSKGRSRSHHFVLLWKCSAIVNANMVLVICVPCGSGKTTIIKDSLKDQTGVDITLPTAEFDDFGSCVLEKLKHHHTLQGITRTQLVLLALHKMKAERKPPLLFRVQLDSRCTGEQLEKLLIHLKD